MIEERIELEAAAGLGQLKLPPRHDPTLKDYSRISGRVGVFGGSFDPIQNAHLYIAQAAKERLSLDYVIFIPTKGNPLKSSSPHSSLDFRVELIADCIRDNGSFFVSEIEGEADSSGYTVDTLQRLREKIAPECSTFLILGSDCIKDLARWHRVHELIAETEFTIIERPGYPIPVPDSIMAQFSDQEVEKLKSSFV